VHVAAAAAGLSVVLATSAKAFMLVKIAGAAYLVYVGISLLRSPVMPEATRGGFAPASLRKIFVQGFLTNVLNPKVALFFIALLPQFVETDAPSQAAALLFLGAIFNLDGTLWNLFVAWSSARIGGGFMRNARLARWFTRCVGGLFVVLGVKLALTSER
jgi:threonine/homoserine/homoserine lactone efflux protein